MSSFPRKREPSAFARTGPESGKSLGSRFRGNDDQGRSSKSRTRVPNPSPYSPATHHPQTPHHHPSTPRPPPPTTHHTPPPPNPHHSHSRHPNPNTPTQPPNN